MLSVESQLEWITFITESKKFYTYDCEVCLLMMLIMTVVDDCDYRDDDNAGDG